jgi:hypothetical protein
MLSLLAKHVVSSSQAFLGSLFALLSLAALLRVCRRPIVKLPAATLVVLSIFAVISAGRISKRGIVWERDIDGMERQIQEE